MNDADPPTHGIVVTSNRRGLFAISVMCILMLLGLVMVGMDIFIIWAFWNQYHIDAGAYVIAPFSLFVTVFMGWTLFFVFYRMRQHGPDIIINSQGFYFYLPLRFTFVPRPMQSFFPWDEIEWIGLSRYGMYAWLCLCLKDPEQYWSRYGHGPYRKWRRDIATRAHINFVISSIYSMSAEQILQYVVENYSAELVKYGVKVKP